MDVGDRRIGLATSRPGLQIAVPSGYILRTRLQDDVQRVLDQVTEKEASGIIVGMPLSLNGTAGPQAKKVQRFVNVLRQHTHLPITMVDERYSTNEAERLMRSSGRQPSREKGEVDAAAAAVILQDYLDQTTMEPLS